MCNLAAEQINRPERWELSADGGIVRIGGFGKDEPDTVVFRLFQAVTQHDHDFVPRIDCKTRKHGSNFRLERR
ncbi:MAG TPA: hypothetical protein VMU48_13210 [Terracidiphilus sp.]|nr:hypothetical protein [Terracidiphilus sp.]